MDVDSSMIPKRSPVAPTLMEIGLEMSTHALALSEALALPLVDTERSPLTVALRSTSKPASRSTNMFNVLSNALSPRLSYQMVSFVEQPPHDSAVPIPLE